MSVVMSLSVWASAIPITAHAAAIDISSGYSATIYPDNMVSNTTVVYTGEAKTVKAHVYSDSDQSTYLTEGVDYEISYADNINVGEATVTITGIGEYTGSFTKPLTIEPMSLVDGSQNNYNVEMTIDDPVCVNKGAGTFCTPSVTVKYCGKALVKDRDYTLSYGNNEGFTFETDTDENITKVASVTVTGMGNFTGSRTLDFNIMPYWPDTEQVDSLYGTFDRDTGTLTTATTAMPFSNDWDNEHLERFKIINLRYTSTVGGYTVPEGAFQDCKNLTEVVLSDGIETIGANAFKYCSKLRKVSYVKRDGTIVENMLPDSLITVGAGAFSDCPELTLNLPDNITSLANASLFGTSDTGPKMLVTKGSTTEATIRARAATSSMYYYYKDYPDYQIVTRNSDYGNDIVLNAYRGNAANVTIPAFFDRIYCAGDRSNFKGYQVKSITVPGNVKQISEEAFQNCYGLRTLTIQPGNITSLPDNLFNWGTNNFTFNVPDNITSFPITSDILVAGGCSNPDITALIADNEWKEDDGSGIGKRWSVTHTFGTPSYVWADDNSTCTATETCTKNSEHKITETVKTTYEITTPATTTAEGAGIYTASFTKSAFTEQTKTVTIPKIEIPVTAVTLDKTGLTLSPDETETLIATVTPDNATNPTVTWTSSAPAVANVDENGKVAALSVGTATITAAAGGKSAVCSVIVVKPTEIKLEDKKEETAQINGADVRIEAAVTYPKAITWTGSKITKTQLAALSEDGVIAKVNLTGLESALQNMKAGTDVNKLIKVSYSINREKAAGKQSSFTVKVALNKTAVKKARIKGDDKAALKDLVDKLNKDLSDNEYKFDIVPINLSDATVKVSATLKNGALQDNEGTLKGLKSVSVKVTLPGSSKVKTYKYTGKTAAKQFTIKVTDPIAKTVDLTAISGSNFTGSLSGIIVN